jgi:hypothetical protein
LLVYRTHSLAQFRTLEMIARSRIRKRAAMGTRAIGKKSLLWKALQNRIKFSDLDRKIPALTPRATPQR